MNNQEKIAQLRSLIYSSLLPITCKRCILLDAPYYHNIGDVLIWTGEQCFFAENGIECIYTASYETCTFPQIDQNVTVFFNGGGNLGDIYHEHMEFLISVVKKYPHNKIIVLPQTFFYKDKRIEADDFKMLKSHENLYICCRDKVVWSHLKETFGDNALLLPDMAFCVSNSMIAPNRKSQVREKLIIDRMDCEKGNVRVGDDGDVSDWPVFMNSFRKSTFFNKIFKRISDARIPVVSSIFNRIWDWYAQRVFKMSMIKEGVQFISPYREVETTRLHGCILSILLDKQITLVNNSYGKNKNFYDSWLCDLDCVTLKS